MNDPREPFDNRSVHGEPSCLHDIVVGVLIALFTAAVLAALSGR